MVDQPCLGVSRNPLGADRPSAGPGDHPNPLTPRQQKPRHNAADRTGPHNNVHALPFQLTSPHSTDQTASPNPNLKTLSAPRP
ncbi:hypothetical protein GCM10009630_69500 [Kribbella jejuensis]